jgi:hypothetical protein
MTDSSDADLSRRAAAFARDAARVVRESGVPRHREKALADLMMAETAAAFESAIRRLGEKIEADPERYSQQERKAMLRAVLADASVRIRATVQEQIVAWSCENSQDSDGESDSA